MLIFAWSCETIRKKRGYVGPKNNFPIYFQLTPGAWGDNRLTMLTWQDEVSEANWDTMDSLLREWLSNSNFIPYKINVTNVVYDTLNKVQIKFILFESFDFPSVNFQIKWFTDQKMSISNSHQFLNLLSAGKWCRVVQQVFLIFNQIRHSQRNTSMTGYTTQHTWHLPLWST